MPHADPRTAAIELAGGMVAPGRFRSDLADLMAHRSGSQTPSQAVGLMRCLTQAPMPRLVAMGFPCLMRFVVGAGTAALLTARRRHLDAQGLNAVRIEDDSDSIHPATRPDPGHPWLRRIAASVARTAGRAPHLLPNLAGSLPAVWVPHSWRGCSRHVPDEHLPVAPAEDGLRIMAGLYWDIGSGNLPAAGPEESAA